MKKLLSLLFCCCLSYSPIYSEETSAPGEFIDIKSNISIDAPEQYAAQTRILSSISKASERGISDYYYRIKEIDLDNRTVTLEDHSRLDIGWWYKDLLLDWQVGDRLNIHRDKFWIEIGNGFGIQNLDKESLAWATFGIWPGTSGNDNSDYIVDVNFTNKPGYAFDYSLITLKSGFQFRVQAHYLGNNLNARVFVYHTGNFYAISLSPGRFIQNAQLWKIGNPDWRQKAQQ